MTKASSPVRIQDPLMQAARLAALLAHRSIAEQIEYWADLGCKVAKIVDPETLLALQAGLVKLSVEEQAPVTLNPNAILAQLEQDRASGALTQAIVSGYPRYQAAPGYPGLLEQIQPDGTVVLGQFHQGQFQAYQPS